MSKYKRQETNEEIRERMIASGEMDENGNLLEIEEEENQEDQSKIEEVIDWKKRHDDGRRYQIQLQSKNKELESRVSDLEARLKDSVSVPDNIEKFEEWSKEYPIVAEMVRIAARKEASQLDDEIKGKLTSLDELTKKNRMIEEKEKLRALQPDFYTEIATSPEFKDWILNKAPQYAREAVFNENNPNAEIVSTVIDSFKVQTNWKSKNNSQRQKTTSNDAASSVRNNKSSAPKVSETSEWSESRVNRMSLRDYEKHENEISEAIRNGTFVYDMSNAQ